MSKVRFKVAHEPREIEQINALHYKAFVEEIPQYARNDELRHVDRFHDENTYIVALDGDTVIGSIAVRGARPFSLDGKLENLDQYLNARYRYCEIRLLIVAKEHRTGNVLPGLIAGVWDYAMERGFDAALISATTRQLKLYRHVGFVAFGPLVGTSEAPFQPMYLTYEAFRDRAREISTLFPAARGEMANLLSGPVSIHPDVVAAFGAGPRSHRSPAFDDDLCRLKASLCALVSAEYVEVLVGSATLGNDAVAAQLSLLESDGLVVSNGEFGERLVDHASRARLGFEHMWLKWGEPFDLDAIAGRAFDWIWIVACETSTGVLNDVAAVDEICRSRDAKLCIDAVSAIGAVPLDLSRAWLATGASGKALAAYPGLSLVFHEQPIGVSDTLPRYLDLGLYSNDRVPFTHSSNLVRALRVAVERVDWPAHFEQTAAAGAWLRRRLRREAFTLIGDRANPAPHIVTIALPPNVHSAEAAQTIERAGFLVGHASSYLRERNWIQVCLMGEWQRDVLPELLRTLKAVV
ncbi:MAG TPA: aminotransferase class V-fold PLP-dependent enzyme [Thermoanaerobaculia bacterium]